MTKSSCEQYYDRVAHQYDDSYKDPYWEFYNEITWQNLKKYLTRLQGRKILDIGGGTGLWALKLAKSGYEITLADISQKMLDTARQKAEKLNLGSKIKFIKSGICNLSAFEPEAFNLILAEGDPLSYCDNPFKAMKECNRVLKPKGFFIASTDNKYGGMRVFVEHNKLDELEELIKTGKTKWFTDNPEEQHPITYFTPNELRKLFNNNGFEVISIIGKTVLPLRHNSELLKNQAAFDRLLKIELKLNSEENLLGSAGHIEIVGIRAS
jgi:ubiquinone/menaquinone biosynthesis C-methylase UbiE